jgi:hypothetical protein
MPTGWEYVSELRPPMGPILYPPRSYIELQCRMILTGKQKNSGEKPSPMPLCPPQIPHGLKLRTHASSVRGRRLTAWAMARPFKSVDHGEEIKTSNCISKHIKKTHVQVFLLVRQLEDPRRLKQTSVEVFWHIQKWNNTERDTNLYTPTPGQTGSEWLLVVIAPGIIVPLLAGWSAAGTFGTCLSDRVEDTMNNLYMHTCTQISLGIFVAKEIARLIILDKSTAFKVRHPVLSSCHSFFFWWILFKVLRCWSSRLQCRVNLWAYANVLEEHTALVFSF